MTSIVAYFCSAINAAKCGAQWPIITPAFTLSMINLTYNLCRVMQLNRFLITNTA